ncbi:MAG: hypothetical protein U5K27_20235 [Desulfotignum sp.]|nr:hypothetical protein [Desulfotignum sp.]
MYGFNRVLIIRRQMIFESMNLYRQSTDPGRRLIRQLCPYGTAPTSSKPPSTRNHLGVFDGKPLLGAESYNTHFDEFMRFFLVIHTGNYRIKKDEVDTRDLRRIHARLTRKVFKTSAGVCRLLLLYCPWQGRKNRSSLLTFKDIRELRADVCYPLLMEVYKDYSSELITKKEFVEIKHAGGELCFPPGGM